MPSDKWVGNVTAYDRELHKAKVHLEAPLHVGDTLRIEAPGVKFEERLDDLRLRGNTVDEARRGDDVEIPMVHDLGPKSVSSKAKIFVVPGERSKGNPRPDRPRR